MYRISFSLLLIFLALFASCSPAIKKNRQQLTIVCTTGMIADGIKNIVQDSAVVIALMGEGVDPHLYKATTGDLEKLYEADIIFYNGLHLEGKMGQIMEKLGKLKPTIALGDGLIHHDLLWADSATHTPDPHIWFDVQLWAKALQRAAKHLPLHDPKNKTFYETNAANYLQVLANLDSVTRLQLTQIPPSQRLLITSHDAFGYFGRRYAIEVKGLQGISTAAEFGLRDVADLVQLICDKKIQAIFTETSVSDKSIQAVVQGCKAKGHEVKIGGHLFTDAMGAANTAEGTYKGMITANSRQIVEALAAK